MALIKEDVTIPARVENRTKAIVCDLCGVVSPAPDEWSEGFYDVDEVTVSHRTGTNYPEGARFTTMTVDLCPACFTNRLLPWLAEHGAKPREEDGGW